MLWRQGEPARVPLFEIGIDDEVLSALLGERVRNPAWVNRQPLGREEVREEDAQKYANQLVRSYYQLGYDYVMLTVYLPWETQVPGGDQDMAASEDGARAWSDEKRGPIATWEDLGQFRWSGLGDVELSVVQHAAQLLPDDMELVICTRGVMAWLLELIGFESLCHALYDTPDLVSEIADLVGSLTVELLRQLAGMERVGAIAIEDDMGFKTSTFVSPDMLRQYVFPWTTEFVAVTHAESLPFILHSCGNLEGIMNDLPDDVGIDAKHSFEDVIMPVNEIKAKYGKRMCILGGIDMDLLASGTPKEVRRATRKAIRYCAPGGGYAVGSGNTIANYVPLENYFAMLQEARRP